MMAVDGPFDASDTIAGTAREFSSGSDTEGRIAPKAAAKYLMGTGRERTQLSDKESRDLG